MVMKMGLPKVSPMIRATYQAAILSGISNVLAQIFQSYRKDIALHLNPIEFLRFVIVTLITSPPNYVWQQYLERTLPAYKTPVVNSIPLTSHDLLDEKKRRDSNAGVEDLGSGQHQSKRTRNWKNTFLKMFIDSITLGAIVNTVLFLVLMGVLKGLAWTKIMAVVQKDTIPVIIAGYKIWPAVSFFSFTFVPVERRIVFFSVFGLFWNIYMSLVAAEV